MYIIYIYIYIKASRAIRSNKVTFLFAKIAMQLRSLGSFYPSMLPAQLSYRFQRDVSNLDSSISYMYDSWLSVAAYDCRRWHQSKNENCVSYYIWPAQIRCSTVILIQALGVIHGLYEYSSSWREMHGRRHCDSLNERPGLITYIAQAIPRFAQATETGELRRSCSSVVFLQTLFYASVYNWFCAADLATCSHVRFLMTPQKTWHPSKIRYSFFKYNVCDEWRLK